MSERTASRLWLLAAALPRAVSPIARLEAQRPISLGVGGGLSLPQGDVDAQVNTGWHALVTAALGSPMQPLGLRFDLAYSRFGFSDQAQTVLGGAGHLATGSATLNFT